MEKRTFQTQMARMMAAYDVQVSAERVAVYWDELRGFSDEVFVIACKRTLAEFDKPFAFPPLATLRRFALLAESAASGGPTSALDAWGEFRRKVTRLNLDLLAGSPESESARVGLTPLDSQIARRLGGWSHLALMPPKDLDWKSREFANVYDELRGRREVEDQLLALEPSRVERSPLLGEGKSR